MVARMPRTPRLPSARATVLCLACLVVLTAVTFTPHLLHGGFYSDDWSVASDVHFDKPTYFGAVRETTRETGGRPVLAAALPLPHVLFPQHPRAQIALGLALGILTCLAFFVVLCLLGLGALSATLIASLALVFPWSDSVRLWPTASTTTIGVGLAFLGFIFALSGLARRGRSSVVLHACAVACYVGSVLTYQVAGFAELFFGAAYLAYAPRRRALRRWAVDVVAVAAALAWSANATRHIRHVAGPREMLADVPTFIRQGGVLFLKALLAFPGADGVPALAVMVVIVLAVVAASIVRARRDEREPARKWLAVAAASVVLLVLADVTLLGSFLHPLSGGIDNRGNNFATFAYAPLVFAVVMLIAGLISRSAATAIGVALVTVILAGWVLRVRSDEGEWRRAAARQRATLASIRSQLPSLPAHATLVAVGYPGQTAPEVPVFEATWDLTGALQLRWNDRTLRGFPVFDDGPVSCGPHALVATQPGSFGTQVLAYGRLYVVSPHGHARVSDRSECRRALSVFPLGPRTVP
jgi:hypothetical protein